MFTQDIVKHYGFHDRMTEKQQLLYGRLFVAAVIIITFVLSLVVNRSIFKISVWAFTGFAAMFPIVTAAIFWKRSTKYGALASVFSVVVLWIYFFIQAGDTPDYTVGGTGVMPVAVILAASAAAMIIVSLLTKPPKQEILDKFFAGDGFIASTKKLSESEKIVASRA